MIEVMKSVDQANGYPFSDLDDNKGNFSQLMSSAVGTDFEFFRLVHKLSKNLLCFLTGMDCEVKFEI